MLQSLWRRWQADRRLGRAWNALDALFPTRPPAGTTGERRDLFEGVWVLDAMMTGWHSSGWPPGSAEEVQSEIDALLQHFARLLTVREAQVLVEVQLAVGARANSQPSGHTS